MIPLERTSIPVEPDEALAALKRFLDSLDPGATGRLVTNLADDLEGNGQKLNTALGGLADLTSTLADKDDELVRIIDHFDDFTATLRDPGAAARQGARLVRRPPPRSWPRSAGRSSAW